MPETGEGQGKLAVDSSVAREMGERLVFPGRVLANWVNERKLPPEKTKGLRIDRRLKAKWEMRAERNARLQIAEAIRTDINAAESGVTPGREVFDIDLDAINRLTPIFDEHKHVKISTSRTDSVTDEPYTAEVTYEKGLTAKIFVAREKRPDGSTISEAKINPSTGSTELTLQYTGDHYQNANPAIVQDNRFPRATALTFKLLAESVLKSDWVSDVRVQPEHSQGFNVDDERLRTALEDSTRPTEPKEPQH